MGAVLLIARWLAVAASVVARLMLVAVVTMLVVQVFLRFCFSYSLPWPEEASRYLMIWIVMLAGSLLVRDDQLVRVDFLDDLWPQSWLVWRNALFRLLLVVMLCVLVWQGWDQAAFGLRRTTTALQISWFWPYLAIPVGGGLMLIQMLARLLEELASGKVKKTDISEAL
jgi:TRAP-type C4-dicarboxylate transport system permease small subunit